MGFISVVDAAQRRTRVARALKLAVNWSAPKVEFPLIRGATSPAPHNCPWSSPRPTGFQPYLRFTTRGSYRHTIKVEADETTPVLGQVSRLFHVIASP